MNFDRLASSAGPALLSALLFGVTTPLAKRLLVGTDPLLAAGLLYLGSGVGLMLWVLLRDRCRPSLGLARSDWPWLAAAVAAGGIVAPALLMFGLAHTDAAVASLLLNLETVLTALLAWVVFREASSPRVVLGFGAILIGSVLLAWPGRVLAAGDLLPLFAIVGACLFWAVDNNLTRKTAAGDARVIAATKGLAAGATNTTLAVLLGASLPSGDKILATLGLGLLGYGLSLVLYIYAMRQVGTTRTAAYFATAPFMGGALSIAIFGQTSGTLFWIAAACMAAGVWLHLTERHSHEHRHEELVHHHRHSHDEHHQHAHDASSDLTEPHTHEHRHEPLRHSHPHYPDIHHRHRH